MSKIRVKILPQSNIVIHEKDKSKPDMVAVIQVGELVELTKRQIELVLKSNYLVEEWIEQ